MKKGRNLLELLAEGLHGRYLARVSKPPKAKALALLAVALGETWRLLPARDRKLWRGTPAELLAKPQEWKRRPGLTAAWGRIENLAAACGLLRWAKAKEPTLLHSADQPKLLKRLARDLGSLPSRSRTEITRAAIHVLVGRSPRRNATKAIKAFIKEVREMGVEYSIDLMAIPRKWGDAEKKAYAEAVSKVLAEHCNLPRSGNEIAHAAITGMLLQAEVFDYEDDDPYLRQKVCEFYLDLISHQTTLFNNGDTGKRISLLKVYDYIDAALARILPPGAGNKKRTSHQALAAVGRYVFSRLDDYPVGSAGFPLCVERGLDNYVSRPKGFEFLDLPALTGDKGSEDEIEKDNIEAVAVCYLAYQLEQVRLFDTADRLTELFVNGMLPVGLDEGGRALDRYYWGATQRLNTAARLGLYSRLFGVPGGDVSSEVRPNTEFETLWMRFLASVSEYRRQKREAMGGVSSTGRARPLYLTDDYVRKAGRDLAGNLSLFGWAGTHYAARRLSRHIKQAINMLKSPSVLKAYGVNNIWQLIEQVASREFGQAPNVVRHRTMAEAGQAVMHLLASKHTAWSAELGKLLFPDPSQPQKPAHFTEDEEEALARWVESWLAVNGIKSDEVHEYSQPAETPAVTSLPSHGGAGGGDSLEQLRQMVAAGQAPTLDQLKSMLPAA